MARKKGGGKKGASFFIQAAKDAVKVWGSVSKASASAWTQMQKATKQNFKHGFSMRGLNKWMSKSYTITRKLTTGISDKIKATKTMQGVQDKANKTLGENYKILEKISNSVSRLAKMKAIDMLKNFKDSKGVENIKESVGSFHKEMRDLNVTLQLSDDEYKKWTSDTIAAAKAVNTLGANVDQADLVSYQKALAEIGVRKGNLVEYSKEMARLVQGVKMTAETAASVTYELTDRWKLPSEAVTRHIDVLAQAQKQYNISGEQIGSTWKEISGTMNTAMAGMADQMKETYITKMTAIMGSMKSNWAGGSEAMQKTIMEASSGSAESLTKLAAAGISLSEAQAAIAEGSPEKILMKIAAKAKMLTDEQNAAAKAFGTGSAEYMVASRNLAIYNEQMGGSSDEMLNLGQNYDKVVDGVTAGADKLAEAGQKGVAANDAMKQSTNSFTNILEKTRKQINLYTGGLIDSFGEIGSAAVDMASVGYPAIVVLKEFGMEFGGVKEKAKEFGKELFKMGKASVASMGEMAKASAGKLGVLGKVLSTAGAGITGVVGGLGKALMTAGTALISSAAWIGNMMMAALLSPVGLVVVAIVALIAGIFLWNKYSDQIKAFGAKVVNAIAEFFEEAVAWLGNLPQKIEKWVDSALQSLEDMLSGKGGDAVDSGFTKALGRLWDVGIKVMPTILKFLWWDLPFKILPKLLWGLAKGLWKILGAGLMAAWDYIKQPFVELGKYIMSLFSDIGNLIGESLAKAVTWAIDNVPFLKKALDWLIGDKKTPAATEPKANLNAGNIHTMPGWQLNETAEKNKGQVAKTETAYMNKKEAGPLTNEEQNEYLMKMTKLLEDQVKLEQERKNREEQYAMFNRPGLSTNAALLGGNF